MKQALKLLAGLCFLALLPWSAQTQTAATPSARGFIIKLKPAAANGLVSPQALTQRAQVVARALGLDAAPPRPLGADYQVLSAPQTLRGELLLAYWRALLQHPDVAYAEPDLRLRRAAVPNDTAYATQQRNLQAPTVSYAAALNMPAAWDISTGTAVTVAVVDTGVRPSHPELVGKLLPGYDFIHDPLVANDSDARDADASDPGDWVTAAEAGPGGMFAGEGCFVEDSSWHGTFIAGLIAANTNNSSGIAGLSWGARIVPVRVSGKCGAYLSDMLDGLRWAAGLSVAGVPTNANPARVINLSFGAEGACNAGASFQTVINEIAAAGALLVVPTGNESGALTQPANCANVLAVGAVRADGLKTSYSNFGSGTTLMAPGGETGSQIYSLSNTGLTSPSLDSYTSSSGTSFTAPQAAGVAALMISLNPALSASQIIERIRLGARAHTNNPAFSSCTSYPSGVCNCTTSSCGAGLLDGPGALHQARNPALRITVTGSLAVNTAVTLDGSASQAAIGAVLNTYQWQQTAGPSVTLSGANSASATFTLPTTTGSFSFRLQATDNMARSAQETVSFSNAATPPPSSGGGGGGALGWPEALALLLLALGYGGVRSWRGNNLRRT